MDPLTSYIAGQRGALEVQRQREAIPLQRQQGQLAVQQMEQQIDAGARQKTLQGAQVMDQFLRRVKEIPDPQQRLNLFQRAIPELKKFGIDLPPAEKITLESVSDTGLIPLETGIGRTLQQMATFQRGQGAIVETPEGGRAFAAEVFDPKTGKIKTETSLIGSQLTSKLGETPEQQSTRKIDEEAAKVSAKGEKSRVQSAIDSGMDSVDPIDDIGRGLELLQSVNTGRPEAVLLAAKEKLGIEATNEAELKSLLGRAVLASLKASFGGNPTEGERAALQEVESSFSQEGGVNKRLLNNTLNKLERKIDRAIFAAEQEGDQFSLRTLSQGKEKINSLRSIGAAERSAAASGQGAPQQQKTGGQIMQDANGNRAMVYPDGSFEEIR